MRNLQLVLLALVLCTACAEAPMAPADRPQPDFITFGQPDAGRHPYVVGVGGEEEGQAGCCCTGALLSPTVVLTAGHCAVSLTPSAVGRIWVGPINTSDGEFPFGGENSYDGTPYAHPDFCLVFLQDFGFGCDSKDGVPNWASHDFGIIVLSEPVPTSIVNEYAQLPPPGVVETLTNRTLLDIVGYGGTEQVHIPGEGGKFWTFPFAPFRATAEFISGNFVHSDEWIRHSTNPAGDNGAVCFGDSGGPTLLSGTGIVIGVASYAPTDFSHFGECTSVTYSGRTDTPEILSWIQGFMN
jgi:secreted trypsin-like serine protease